MKNRNWEQVYQEILRTLPHKAREYGFKKWFMDNEQDSMLFDAPLVGRCYTIYMDMIKRDRDHFALIVGSEGSGKTTLAIQMCFWIDPNFCVDNICFTPEDYVRRLRVVKPGSCLLIDEGGAIAFTRESMTQNNITMTKIYMLQRQKNVSVVVCCPSFWDIDTYLRRHRVNTLLRITKQGEYFGYLPKAIKIINDVGYRKKDLSKIRVPNGSFWTGKFRREFPKTINREDYLKKKGNHLDTFLSDIEKDFNKTKLISTRKYGELTGSTADSVWDKIKYGSLQGTKIGGRWYLKPPEGIDI